MLKSLDRRGGMQKGKGSGVTRCPFLKREKRERKESVVSIVRSDCFLLLTGNMIRENCDQNIGMMFPNYEFDF